MRQVWKFTIPMRDEFGKDMPEGSEVLSVQTQDGNPVMWAMVDPDAPTVRKSFRLAGTGHPIDEKRVGRFLGTFQLNGGNLVFHLFEGGAS